MAAAPNKRRIPNQPTNCQHGPKSLARIRAHRLCEAQMVFKSVFFALCIALLIAASPAAQAFTVNSKPLTSTQKNIETLGSGVAIALPVTAGVIAWSKDDEMGFAQLAAETFLTVGTAEALKNIVREERPNGAGGGSFPSATTALAASGSSFLWGRYGWEYGLPVFSPPSWCPIAGYRRAIIAGTTPWPVRPSPRAMALSSPRPFSGIPACTPASRPRRAAPICASPCPGEAGQNGLPVRSDIPAPGSSGCRPA